MCKTNGKLELKYINIILLYIVMAGVLFTLFAIEYTVNGTWVNILILSRYIKYSIYASWKYLFLLFPKKHRSKVWAFAVFDIIVVAMVSIQTFTRKEYQGYMSFDLFGGKPGELIIILILFGLFLISTCIACLAVAPTNKGKIIFIIAMILLAAISLSLLFITDEIPAWIISILIILLGVIVLLICLFPNQLNNISPADGNDPLVNK